MISQHSASLDTAGLVFLGTAIQHIDPSGHVDLDALELSLRQQVEDAPTQSERQAATIALNRFIGSRPVTLEQAS